MNWRRACVAVAVVGLLMVTAPLSLPMLADAVTHQERTTAPYHGIEVGPDAEGQVLNRMHGHATEIALSTDSVSDAFSPGEFRAPNETRRTLEAAIRDGSATTDDPDATADLRGVERNYTYVYDRLDGNRSYAAVDVTENGSRVETEPVTERAVLNATAETVAVDYADLEPETRRAVDRIVADTSDGWGDYRPRVDNPVVEREPMLVRTDGALYDVRRGDGTYLGPGFKYYVIGLGIAALGAVLIVVGGGGYAVLRWRGQS